VITLRVLALVFWIFAVIAIISTAQSERDHREVVQASEILKKIELDVTVYYADKIIEGDIDISDLNLPEVRTSRSPNEIKYEGLSENLKVVRSPLIIQGCLIKGDMNFTNALILGVASFYNNTILGDTNFRGSQFNQSANFRDSRFNGSSYFCWSQFNQIADFFNSRFNQSANFSNSQFEDAVFMGSLFNQSAYFIDSLFNRSASFRDSRFGDAFFMGSRFNQTVDFSNSRFNLTANFRDSRFGGALFIGSRFNQTVDFSNSLFNQNANFRDSRFEDALFMGSRFNQTAEFESSIFNQTADFSNSLFVDAFFKGSQFNQSAYFRKSRFNRTAYFKASQFNNTADFRASQFNNAADFVGSQFDQTAYFRGSRFNETAYFVDCQFEDAIFIWAYLKSADFRRAKFSGDLSFEGSQIDRLNLIEAEFSKIGLRSWKSIGHMEYDEMIYQLLISNFRNQNLPEAANDCYYDYRNDRRATLPLLYQPVDYALMLFYGYGMKPDRPIIWSFVFIALFAGLFWWRQGILPVREGEPEKEAKRFSLLEAVAFSAMTYLSGGKLVFDPPEYKTAPGRPWRDVQISKALFILERLLGMVLIIMFAIAVGKTIVLGG